MAKTGAVFGEGGYGVDVRRCVGFLARVIKAVSGALPPQRSKGISASGKTTQHNGWVSAGVLLCQTMGFFVAGGFIAALRAHEIFNVRGSV